MAKKLTQVCVMVSLEPDSGDPTQCDVSATQVISPGFSYYDDVLGKSTSGHRTVTVAKTDTIESVYTAVRSALLTEGTIDE